MNINSNTTNKLNMSDIYRLLVNGDIDIRHYYWAKKYLNSKSINKTEAIKSNESHIATKKSSEDTFSST